MARFPLKARFPLNKRKKNGGRLPRERAGGLSDGARDAVHGATIRPAGPSRRLWSLRGLHRGGARPAPSAGKGNSKVTESAVLDATTECWQRIVARTVRQLSPDSPACDGGEVPSVSPDKKRAALRGEQRRPGITGDREPGQTPRAWLNRQPLARVGLSEALPPILLRPRPPRPPWHPSWRWTRHRHWLGSSARSPWRSRDCRA
jgi:hypothetical protein